MQPNPCVQPGIAAPGRMKFAAAIVLMAGIALVTLMLARPASATLGENVNSTETDRASMKATLRMVPASKFTVHEIQTPSGTAIREFVSPEGTVFAVAWRGPAMPDLRQALGSYFKPYVQAAGGKQGGHRHRTIREPGLVVQSHGHMRAFSGRAYVPQLIPQGVAVEEIR